MVIENLPNFVSSTYYRVNNFQQLHILLRFLFIFFNAWVFDSCLVRARNGPTFYSKWLFLVSILLTPHNALLFFNYTRHVIVYTVPQFRVIMTVASNHTFIELVDVFICDIGLMSRGLQVVTLEFQILCLREPVTHRDKGEIETQRSKTSISQAVIKIKPGTLAG